MSLTWLTQYTYNKNMDTALQARNYTHNMAAQQMPENVIYAIYTRVKALSLFLLAMYVENCQR